MGQVRLATGAVVNRFFVIPRFQCRSGLFLPPPELIKVVSVGKLVRFR